MKLILLTILMSLAINTYANNNNNTDSLGAHIAFETGFLLRKKMVIKINKEVIAKEKIKTIAQLGWAYSCDVIFRPADKVVIKVGLFSHKLNKNKIVKGYNSVKIKRIFFLNFYTYDKMPSFYD